MMEEFLKKKNHENTIEIILIAHTLKGEFFGSIMFMLWGSHPKSLS